MESVAERVRREVLSDPVLALCLARGLASPSAVARHLLRRLGSPAPRLEAVKMAVHRLARELQGWEESLGVERVLARSALAVQDRIAVVTYPRSALERAAAAVTSLAGRSRFVQLVESVSGVTVMVAEEDLHTVLGGVGRPLELLRGQSAVIVVSPREIIETPGVVAFLAGFLAGHGINITQIVSAYVDTIIIVDGRDAPRAYNALHNLIHRLGDSQH